MRISDWSSDVCSSDLDLLLIERRADLRLCHRVLLDIFEEPFLVLRAILLRGLRDQPAHFLLADLHVVDLADLRQQKAQTHAAHGDGAIVLALRLQLGLGGLYIVFMARLMEKLLPDRSEEHTSELQSLMRLSYAVFCLKKKKT